MLDRIISLLEDTIDIFQKLMERNRAIGRRRSSFSARVSLITIDLLDSDGDEALYTRDVEARCEVGAMNEVRDYISVEGTQELVGVLNLKYRSTEEVLGKGRVDIFNTIKPITKGEIFRFIINRKIYHSFRNSREYWDSEQFQENDKVVFRIVFPRDRKFSSYTGKIRRSEDKIGEYILPPNQIKEVIVDGRPALEWVFGKNTVGDCYRIEWDW